MLGSLRRVVSSRSGRQVTACSEDGVQAPHSRADRLLMEEYLPDFGCEFQSSKADHSLIAEHWSTLFYSSSSSSSSSASPRSVGHPNESPMVALFDNFYKFLFELAPDARPMFRSSMHVQGKALMRIIGSIMGMLKSPDLIAEAAHLALRHIQYGVRMEHFNPLGVALAKTLESCSSELWTHETANAWKQVYCHVALVVLSEMAKHARQRQRSSLMQSLVPNVRHSEVSEPNGARIRVAAKYTPPPHKSASTSCVGDCPFSGQPGAKLPPDHPPVVGKSTVRRKTARYNTLAEYISRTVADLFRVLAVSGQRQSTSAREVQC